jgi:chromate reductase, NAD(P)H dehydrogenase (quinone)
MKYIIAGTNRPGSNSLKIAKIMQALYKEINEETEIIDLQEFPLKELDGTQYSKNKPAWLQEANRKLVSSDGIVIIVPEYNGSMPGVLKLFIDHLEYPNAFLHRPISLVGLGGMFAGLRPVEHCQQVFGYRNAFIYPDRVFLPNVWTMIENDKINRADVMQLLVDQTKGFTTFVHALKTNGLHACSFVK